MTTLKKWSISLQQIVSCHSSFQFIFLFTHGISLIDSTLCIHFTIFVQFKRKCRALDCRSCRYTQCIFYIRYKADLQFIFFFRQIQIVPMVFYLKFAREKKGELIVYEFNNFNGIEWNEMEQNGMEYKMFHATRQRL